MFPAFEQFCGDRLRLAREFRGLTQQGLAKEVVASNVLISHYENGKKHEPTDTLVDAFASVLGFRREFFFRPVEDPFTEAECHFRHRLTTPEKLKTQVRAHATLMGILIDAIKRRVKLPTENLPIIRATTPAEIDSAAEQTRKHWGLNLDAPLAHPGRIMENAGVMIVPHIVKSPKIDAFSRQGKATLIFLNLCVSSSSRWTFDIAHECGHLVMHAGINTGDAQTESAADRFGSALLLPKRAFSREFRAATFSWRHVFELKRHWRASAGAIVTRAYHLDLLSAVEYRRAFQYMSKKGWRSNGEPNEPPFQQPELLDMALKAVNSKPGALRKLSEELGFPARTFEEITGTKIPEDAPSKPKPILLKR